MEKGNDTCTQSWISQIINDNLLQKTYYWKEQSIEKDTVKNNIRRITTGILLQ